ncbi:MAG: NAD(+)/NADH kinase, partial [Solirubrobacteraceae bacterium]|nr:NAD(+)/NADH kinase [Solirubrobacteraceae bacterium]
MSEVPRQRVVLMTHDAVRGIESPVRALLGACSERGVELCIDESEASRERLVALGLTVIPSATTDPSVQVVITLGGDGTILRALREFSGTGVAVFAVNFGQVGFLATAEPVDLVGTFAHALDGEFDRLQVPAVTVSVEGVEGEHFGMNDVSIHRRMGSRVAELGYGVDTAIIGAVRCDGLVACTPAGSTGYNLANGGPIMAWGVEGYAVSFIAPHSLTARSIVVSPNDNLVVENRGQDALELLVDGRANGVLVDPGRRVTLGYRPAASVLAQMPGSSFYARLREKFGHL